MALQLKIKKEGEDSGKKLKLNLKKGSIFRVELYWESSHDLDAHALLAHNDGNGAKITSLEQILSTYNRKKSNSSGILEDNPDNSFSTPCRALTHSGDSRTGIGKAIDETITIDGSKIKNGVNEIPLFVTIHPATSTTLFATVSQAGIRIKDDSNNLLGEYELTKEFGKFNAVQMGSLVLGENGWEFAEVGVGFNGDFNFIIENFS